jgi:hypothetical protein
MLEAIPTFSLGGADSGEPSPADPEQKLDQNTNGYTGVSPLPKFEVGAPQRAHLRTLCRALAR